MEEKETFQTRLRAIRKARGLTGTEAARRIHVARNTWSQYESGARVPHMDTIADIARALETSTDYLLLLTDDPAPNLDYNINEYLNDTRLHFDGVPLSKEELQPLREFIGMIIDKKKVSNSVEIL